MLNWVIMATMYLFILLGLRVIFKALEAVYDCTR